METEKKDGKREEMVRETGGDEKRQEKKIGAGSFSAPPDGLDAIGDGSYF